MEQVEFKAEVRERTGSNLSRRLRRDGRLPVNLFGHGQDSVALHVDAHEFEVALRHHVRVVQVNLQSGAESAVIDRLQHAPISQKVIHADLRRISLTEKIEVGVPLKLHGPAEGIKEGGVLTELHATVKVRCLPTQIPEEILVDVRPMKLHESLHARSLVLPKDVELADSPDLLLLSVVEPRHAAVETAPAEAEVAEPELIGRVAATDEAAEKPEKGEKSEKSEKKEK